MEGQMSIFDFPQYLPGAKKEEQYESLSKEDIHKSKYDLYKSKSKKLKIPCMRECDVEWCSIACFERRGQIYDKVHREWCRGVDGEILVRAEKECDWTPRAVVSHKDFCEHCTHRGWAKKNENTGLTSWMCGFANGRNAECWDDWVECTEDNCPLITKGEKSNA